MLAIIDYRSSKIAIEKLAKIADDILLFKTQNITYNSISCHPDIFVHQDSENLIIAPNSPKKLFDFLKKHNLKFQIGIKNIGSDLENSVLYNCIATNDLFLHKLNFTDESILNVNSHKKFINIPQAYTRCSLIHIGNNVFITSDKGIENELKKNDLSCFYFSPNEIKIIEHKNGFLGGTCGIFKHRIFFNGNIFKHENGLELASFLEKHKLEIVCLHDDFLYDGGGIFFF
ncbi:MAG TPA: hypothetical protein DDX39_12670 [Bacteroidales bacterium]|nr:MAG: hypothetical protein A2W98_05665 [Bacteroidetes bacterium GWF2_33_38]HBF89486.1 hypothetical protein [Bacteroidales bacterium]